MDATLIELLRPVISRATRIVLETEFGPQGAASVLSEATRRYRAASRSLPREKTVGARVMVRLAAFTVCLFRALEAREVPAERAKELISEITWQIYRKLSWLPWKATRVLSNDPLVRARATMDLLMRFPYSRPGYRMDYVDAGNELVAFDVSRCPVAEYFAREALSGLGEASFCGLDFALASEWGLALDRPLTISRGDDHCDFRFCKRGPHAEGQTSTKSACS